MSSRDYYKVSYMNKGADRSRISLDHDVLDNDTEFNANQFKLYDDFTTDLRMAFNPLRRNYHDITRTDMMMRRRGDPNDSGVDMENGNPLEDVSASNDSDLVSKLRSRLVLVILYSVLFCSSMKYYSNMCINLWKRSIRFKSLTVKFLLQLVTFITLGFSAKWV